MSDGFFFIPELGKQYVNDSEAIVVLEAWDGIDVMEQVPQQETLKLQILK